MKRVLTTSIAIALLLGLGVLAVLARPANSNVVLAPDPGRAAAALNLPAAPYIPASTTVGSPKWNAIAMALDSTATISNAQTLANVITGTQQLLRWDATPGVQTFEYYIPDPIIPGGFGTNFSMTVGAPYMVQVDSTAPMTFTLVGNVPPQTGNPGAVQFSLAGATPCLWNFISLPLDRTGITNAQGLADAITNVRQVLRWDATPGVQTFEYYIPDPVIPGGFGTNFTTRIGYPYFVCLTVGRNWP